MPSVSVNEMQPPVDQVDDFSQVSIAFAMLSLAASDLASSEAQGAGTSANRRNALAWASGLSSDGISFSDCCKVVGADPVVMRTAILGDPGRFISTVRQLASALESFDAEQLSAKPNRPRF